MRPLCRVAPLLAASFLVACTEGTGPESLGQLRLRPVFAPGEDPASLGIAVSRIRVQLRRADGAVLSDTTLSYQAGETTSWLVDLDEPPESVNISAGIGQGAAVMYAGTGQVLLAAGIGPSSTHHDLPVRYLGETSTPFSVDVSPDSASLAAPGDSHQFTAVARDASGAALTGFTFGWTSSRPNVATVNATGVVTAVSTGVAIISATSGGVTGVAVVSVGSDVAIPVRLSIAPDTGVVLAGDTLRFRATVFDQRDQVIPGSVFQWNTVDTLVAVVDSTGLTTARNAGRTKVVASLGGLADTAVVIVTDNGTGTGVASIIVLPQTAVLTSLGDTLRYTAIARDEKGNVITGVAFTWSSSNASVAGIGSSGGLATANSPGTVTIRATAGGLTGTATLIVNQVVHTVDVSPTGISIISGAKLPFVATARDRNGHLIHGTTFTWTTSNPAVASIDGTGTATGVSHGTTEVRASAGGVSGVATLHVVTVASITIEGAPERHVVVGSTIQFRAVVRDVAGNIVPGLPVLWSVTQPAIATINPSTGLATGLAVGLTLVRATFGSLVDEVELVVLPKT